MFRFIRWIALGACVAVFMGSPIGRAATSNGGATIRVTVLNASGKPVAGAKVGLIEVHRRPTGSSATSGQHSRPTPVATGVTDENGVAELTNVSNGHYAAIAHLRGDGVGHERVRITGASGVSVTITLRPRSASPNPKTTTTAPVN